MPVQCICQRCGTVFSTKPSHAQRRKYCSRKCKGMPLLSFTCEWCGTEFQRQDWPQFRASRFCSVECNHAAKASLPQEQRAAMIANAQAAVRGMKRSHDDLCKRSRTKQERAVLSGDEAEIMAALNRAGLFPIPLYSVDKYNIDFAFPDAMLAVEYNGGNWHNTPAKRAGDEVKAVYLKQNGWRLIVFPRIDKPHTNNSGNRPIAITEIVRQVKDALDLA